MTSTGREAAGLERHNERRGVRSGSTTEKGAGVSASPPCRRTFGLAQATGGCARLHVGGMLGPRRQGKRALRPGQRSADASRWPSPNGKPPGGIPASGKPHGGLPVRRQAALGPVTGAGAIPKDQLPTSMSFAPPLPCGIGFAISVIQSWWPRRIAVSRWPRPVLVARRLRVPCVWSSGLTCTEAPACPDNPLDLCPKAPASRFGRLACPCSGGAFSALVTRLSHAEARERRFGHPIRFVSIPPALASGTGRFPGWCPRIGMRGFPKAPARVDPL